MRILITTIITCLCIALNAQDRTYVHYTPDTISSGIDTTSVIVLYITNAYTGSTTTFKAKRAEEWAKLLGTERIGDTFIWHSGSSKTVVNERFWVEFSDGAKINIDSKDVLQYWVDPYPDHPHTYSTGSWIIKGDKND